MKILVIGGGGREHALCWKIRQSPLVTELFCAPGNAGIAGVATRVPIEPGRVTDLVAFAASERIDLTVVGPELPLTLGIADALAGRGLAVSGASRAAAEIESSKVFSKEFMRRHGIPTAEYEAFATSESARAFLQSRSARFPCVVKADGLAAGKGVAVCLDRAQALAAVHSMMDARVHGEAGARVVVEEFLEGREASFFALTDGHRTVPLVTCQDYKRAGDGDTGSNTGGMGAYSPSVFLDAATRRDVLDRIALPTIAGLGSEGREYRGILYVGLMLTPAGPRVLEYNARLGDPEAQVLLPRLASDIVPLLASAAAGRVDEAAIEWRPESAVAVVIAAGGYPGPYATGMTIHGLTEAETAGRVTVFHAGTATGPDGLPAVSGGRVATVAALGRDLAEAAALAYDGASRIRFEGMHYRRDIARDALAAQGTGASR